MLKNKAALLLLIISMNSFSERYVIRTTDTGTFTLDNSSCLTLFEDDNSLIDGTYKLKNGNYLCDMSSGGWTLIEDINSSTNSAGSFVKTSGFSEEVVKSEELKANFPEDDANEIGFWSHFESNLATKTNRSLTSNSEGTDWKEAKILIDMLYFYTVDSFQSTNRSTDFRTGKYVDGLDIITEDELVAVFTLKDHELRQAKGIKNEQLFLGNGTFDINYSKKNSSSSTIELRGMLDQEWRDEDVGFKSYKVWIK